MSSTPKVLPNIVLAPIPTLEAAPLSLTPIPELRPTGARPSGNESLESGAQRQRRETSAALTGTRPVRSAIDLPAPGASRPSQPSSVSRAAPVAPTSPYTALQEHIREIAFAEIGTVNYSARGSDGAPLGWQHLQDIFEQSAGYRPSDAEIKRTAHPGNPPIHWCGMFATYVWQNAGIDTHWAWGEGPQGPQVMSLWPYSFRTRAEFESSVQVGDILVGPGPSWHHSLVVSVDNGVITTVDGNTVALNPAGESGRTVITEPLTQHPEGELPQVEGPQGPLSHGIALRSDYDRSRIQRIIRPRALHPG